VANESQARECLRLGAADFMGKPVQLDRLNEVLTFLEQHAMPRAAELEGRPEKRGSTRARLAIPVRLSEYAGPPIEVIAILFRIDKRRPGLTFVRLAPRDVERLRELIRRALA
jgi:hypothetical protein